MKRSDFSAVSPGSLVRVSGGLAYLPSALPPTLAPSWELTRTIETARAAITDLSARLSQMNNPELILRPLRRREAVLSSRIEGTITHVRDVFLAEAAPTALAEPESDLREVLNYTQALDMGRQAIADGQPLTRALIRELHRTLLERTRGASRNPGNFRRILVQIGGTPNDLDSARFVRRHSSRWTRSWTTCLPSHPRSRPMALLSRARYFTTSSKPSIPLKMAMAASGAC